MTTEPTPRRPTLARAVLDHANHLHVSGFESQADALRKLVQEHADTEDPEPEDATVLPPLPELDALPNIPEETT